MKNDNITTPREMPPMSGRVAWALLLLILCVSLPLRLYRLAEPVGGRQGYSEAKSMLFAESIQSGSPLDSSDKVKPLTIVPPMGYAFLVYAFRWLPFPLLFVARLIILIAGLAGIFLVFDLARRMFSPGVGWIAATLYAFTPIEVMLGRSAQPEMLALALLLLAHWILLRSNPDPDKPVSQGIRKAGLAWGIAALIHPAVLISLPVWLASECWRHRSLAALKNRNIWSITGLALLPSLALYGYGALRDFHGFVSAIWGGTWAAVPTMSKLAFSEFPIEAWWGFSPLILSVIAAGIIWSLRQSSWQCRYLLLQTSSYLIVALLFYQYNTYLLWLPPFGSMLAAALIWHIRRRSLAIALTVLIGIQGILLSLLMLCSLNYGFTEFSQLLNYYKSTCNRCMILVREGFYDTKNLELQYYFGSDRIINVDRADLSPDHQVRIDSLNDRIYTYFLSSSKGSGGDFDVSRVMYSLVLFGVEIRSSNPNYFHFNPGQWTFTKKHSWTSFGVHESGLQPSVAIMWVSRSTALFRDGDRIIFK
jgi:hypothetical protein